MAASSSHIYIILVAYILYAVNTLLSIDISTLSRNIYFPNLVFADRAYSSKHASEQNTYSRDG